MKKEVSLPLLTVAVRYVDFESTQLLGYEM